MSAKQDRQGVRTAKDLEQKYNFGQSFSEVQKSIKVATNTAEQAEKQALKAQSEILQLSDSIALTVDNGESTAQIKLKVGDREIPATIDMKGLVTFSNLESEYDGTTVINGSNITTGQILADLIKAGTIKSKDGESVVIDLDNGTADIIGNVTTRTIDDGSGGVYVSSLTPLGVTMGTDDAPENCHVWKDHLQFISEYGKIILQNGKSDFSGIRLSLGDIEGNSSAVLHATPKGSTNAGGYLRFKAVRGQTITDLNIQCRYGEAYIRGLTAPQYDNDAVNKAYVDGNFAPAGYGLGGDTKYLVATDDLNSITQCGFYSYAYNGIPANGAEITNPFQYVYHLTVSRDANGTIVQEITTCGVYDYDANYRVRRVKGFGAWSPWEYENPPMTPGVEYRTTERHSGYPVYAQIVDLESLPVSGLKFAYPAKPIPPGAGLFEMRGVIYDSSTGYRTALSMQPDLTVKINTGDNVYRLDVQTTADLSHLRGWVLLKYIIE